MHPASVAASVSFAASGDPALMPEKVSVRHIRLLLPRQRISAKVGTFFAADKVLSSWALHAQGPLECEFEIVYHDGHTLAGEYRFRSRGTKRPSLMAFIRKTIRSLCDEKSGGPLVRGLFGDPYGFLARYETDDFTSS